MRNRFFIGLLISAFIFLVGKQSVKLQAEIFQNTNRIVADLDSKVENQTNRNLSFYLPKSTTSQVVEHSYYTLSYNE